MDKTFEGLEIFRKEKVFGRIEKVIGKSDCFIRMYPGKSFQEKEKLVLFVPNDKIQLTVCLNKTSERFLLKASVNSSESVMLERKYKRINMTVLIGVDDKEIKATSIDVSQGGMKFVLDRAICKGKVVNLKFEIDEHFYNINAIIVNLKKKTVGFQYNVQFIDMSEADVKYIRASLLQRE